VVLALGVTGCTNKAALSEQRAEAHVEYLARLTPQDVAEVRAGLPLGTAHLELLWEEGKNPQDDPQASQVALERARGKVQDLRIAKSTFFAVTLLDGTALRSDQEQDTVVGKKLFEAFPGLKVASSSGYAETTGTLHELRGVEGKPDGQWAASAAVKHQGRTVGHYVTGWSWALYARRLHVALDGRLYEEEVGKKPLVYVFVIVGNQAFGRREAPQINADEIVKLDPLANTAGEAVFRAQLEIAGREFGLAAKRTPVLGDDVMVAVLRSEI
jgi:hypothetical protein